MDYAVIATGGKQYKVSPGDTINVEKLGAAVGSLVELTDVLTVSKDGQVMVGQPTIVGAKVVAEVKDERKGRKLIVFKFKPKTRYKRTKGHRQPFTRLTIREIIFSSS
jgi:large subunit ribosomal protein L21